MSLAVVGITCCPLCEQRLEPGQSLQFLPAFVWNQAEPFGLFNDATLHLHCFQAHPLHAQVERLLAELSARTGPGHRRCAVCASEITDPDDCLMIPRLTTDPADPLARYNYTHLHRAHARRWREFEELTGRLRALQASGVWKGEALDALLRALESAAA